ncbi:MAG TPA: hypothetical protein DHM42_06120 [Clostridiales bacterium]|nr:hypothetical protein [Clostridiales bacterium]
MKKLKTIKTKKDAALVASEILGKIAYDSEIDILGIGFQYYRFDGLKTNSFLISRNSENENLLAVERHDNCGGSGFGNIEKKNFPTYVWENRKDINHTGSFYGPDVEKPENI